MTSPEFNSDGYPTNETLTAIAEWKHPFDGLEEFLTEAFKGYGRVWREKGLLKIATGGWSGNEEMIAALQDNVIFWAMCWDSSHRGGLFVFQDIPKVPAAPEPPPSHSQA